MDKEMESNNDIFKAFASSKDPKFLPLISNVFSEVIDSRRKLRTLETNQALMVGMLVVPFVEQRNNMDSLFYLSSVMDANLYRYADDFLGKYFGRKPCERLLSHLTNRVADSDNEGELMYTMRIFKNCVFKSYERQCLFCSDDALMDALFRTAAKLPSLPFHVQMETMQLLKHIVVVVPAKDVTDRSYQHVWEFLFHKGLSILTDALLASVSAAQNDSSENANYSLIYCLDAMTAMFESIVAALEDIEGDLDPALYRYDPERVAAVMNTFDTLLGMNSGPYQLPYTAKCTLAFGAYLLAVEGGKLVEDLLLYGGTAVQPALVVRLQRVGKQIGWAQIEHAIEQRVQQSTALSKRVANAVALYKDQWPAPRPQRVKDRHCAYPDCLIDGAGLCSRMKKCARCRDTYYCGVDHQEMHWSEHRPCCVKVVQT